jgi:hypothetical protein
MQQIQLIFDRLVDAKKRAKDIKIQFKDALQSSLEYQDYKEKIKTIRERMKQIQASIKQDMSSEIMKLEDLGVDIESEQMMLSDAAMTQLMKGETVEVEDEYGNKYEPVITVKFKKI